MDVPLHVPVIGCSVPDCSFVTPAEISVSYQIEILRIHITSNHHTNNVTAAVHKSLLESLPRPRPVFSLNMTEVSWQSKEVEWRDYIAQAPVFFPERVQLEELRAACDAELQQRMSESGDWGKTTSVTSLLARIKELGTHQDLHRVHLHQMVQHQDEPIRDFVGRLSMTASLCGLVLSCHSCQGNICFRDEIVKTLALIGMNNQDIKERTIQRIVNGESTDLDSLIEFISEHEDQRISAGKSLYYSFFLSLYISVSQWQW